jgi:signal transduction histidine kinase
VRLTRTRRLLDATADPLLALALLGLGVYEIWIETEQVAGPRAGNTAFLVLVTVPLAWRRRYPFIVLTLVTLGAIGWVSAWYFEQQPPFVPFVALLLCVFAVAATATGRAVTAGAGLLAAFVLTDLAAVVLGGRPEETAAAWILLALTWALGRIVHRQRSLTAALAERAVQLEREREEKARLAVALERARIARELHDVVTHNVSVMVVQAGVERRLLGENRGSTSEVLRAVEQTGRETLVELRRLLGVLRKGDERLTLAPQPSLGRLDELIEHIGDAGLPVELRIEGKRTQLPAGVELSAYRIVQEALTNSLRHADAARAEVLVRYGSDALEIEVADDGRGPANGADGGHGLVGMRERAALHGGVLEAGARSGGGYTVRARLPITGS